VLQLLDGDRLIEKIVRLVRDASLIQQVAGNCGDPNHGEECPTCAARLAGIEEYLQALGVPKTTPIDWWN